MNKHHVRRIFSLATWVSLIGLATLFVLLALNQHIQLFYTPSEIIKGEAPKGRLIRVGGLVVDHSIERAQNTVSVSFDLTDTQQQVKVHYVGILPDLFKAGQGVVVQGFLQAGNLLEAKQVLAKHDENYRPPEVDYALKKAFKEKMQRQSSL